MPTAFALLREGARGPRGGGGFGGLLFRGRPLAPPAAARPGVKVLFLYEASGLSGDGPARSRGLLDRMAAAMGLAPGDRLVLEFSREEAVRKGWEERLAGAVAAARPSVVVALGALAADLLLPGGRGLAETRGRFFRGSFPRGGGTAEALVMPVFHPDFLLINPGMKRPAWTDLRKVMARLG